jgi:hypothetical protein
MRGVDAAIETHARLAAELRVPGYLYWTSVWRTMQTTVAGRFEEAERLALESFTLAQQLGDANAISTMSAQILAIYRQTGRLGEIEESVRNFVAQYPSLRPWCAALAHVQAVLGRFDEARRTFAELAARDFADLRRDAFYPVSLALAADACALLGDTGRAHTLYDALSPYRGRSVVVGDGVACLGPVAHYLGVLAATMSRWEDASELFAQAVATAEAMGAAPFGAISEYEHARAILARGAPADRVRALALRDRALASARTLGMVELVEKAGALE